MPEGLLGRAQVFVGIRFPTNEKDLRPEVPVALKCTVGAAPRGFVVFLRQTPVCYY